MHRCEVMWLTHSVIWHGWTFSPGALELSTEDVVKIKITFRSYSVMPKDVVYIDSSLGFGTELIFDFLLPLQHSLSPPTHPVMWYKEAHSWLDLDAQCHKWLWLWEWLLNLCNQGSHCLLLPSGKQTQKGAYTATTQNLSKYRRTFYRK